ncbi:hypothetical protein CHLNCDRAFT_144253 [Chlorella variabilis]|uniref:Uncharacterized protein n=1 Tax=Chlorella variabilis TaxID=554065 RepID=E1ZC98_CHLVA|nr:hypothetical protein CHLNCDRAFT_144253 [Chlorella variabilis]EFN56574.1 hypothetical protein CHLNCDRAFT_144253 [Chlorella variabilis]|eukprot:XP_005848676.1 hypothetical protein CHLNCDRAFT_144253 [Chlorella variabilis]
MANWSAACGHCTKREVVHCCGVCTFDRERCNSLYPRQDKPKAVADLLMRSGFAAFTPCELFQRIRGRTMWFMGDSQTWAFYYAAECFLREFAPSLRRTPAVAPEENQQLKIVSHISPPLCLNLARNTRVCGVRVDYASDVQKKVLPRLMKLVPNFKEDIVVLNTGLHYPEYDHPETPSPRYVQELTALAEWRQLHADFLPRIVWMDTGPQHFFTHEGTFPGHGKRPFKCRPLDAWYKGDPVVGAGTRRAMAVAPIVSRLADAHLQIYNATVPLWDSHLPGECSHWCQPSAYQLWLYLLNDVLRDSELGNAVRMPGSPAGDSRR